MGVFDKNGVPGKDSVNTALSNHGTLTRKSRPNSVPHYQFRPEVDHRAEGRIRPIGCRSQ
jgi:hypothetical protein